MSFIEVAFSAAFFAFAKSSSSETLGSCGISGSGSTTGSGSGVGSTGGTSSTGVSVGGVSGSDLQPKM